MRMILGEWTDPHSIDHSSGQYVCAHTYIQDILTYFRGSELQNYFTRVLEDNLKAIIKPQVRHKRHIIPMHHRDGHVHRSSLRVCMCVHAATCARECVCVCICVCEAHTRRDEYDTRSSHEEHTHTHTHTRTYDDVPLR